MKKINKTITAGGIIINEYNEPYNYSGLNASLSKIDK